MTASVVHDFTGSPSTSTVHTPQLEVSQPQCVPVRPSVSRRKWTSSRRGSTSAERGSPLTVTVICTSGLLGEGALARATDGAQRELLREVTLVIGGAALVGGRGAVGRRAARRLGEGLLGRWTAAQGVLGPARARGVRPHGGQRDARVGDRAAVELHHRGRRGDRPVSRPALDLLVRAAHMLA